jgi:hypothetical protein
MLQIEAWLHDAFPQQFPILLSGLVELFKDHLADWKMKTIPKVWGVLEVRGVLVHSRQAILLRLLGPVIVEHNISMADLLLSLLLVMRRVMDLEMVLLDVLWRPGFVT